VHLCRRDVVDKANQLLDDYGIADLTMRRLARELNVSPGALYWHFADKQELLGAVADKILEPTTHSARDGASHWEERMLVIGSALRDALLSTTDGAELVSASFAAGKSAMVADLLTRLAAAAIEAGIASDHAELVARTLVHYVLGFTADEQSRIQWDAAGALSDEQSVLAIDPTARFAFGLRLLVTGVAHVSPLMTRSTP
jgi:TetR/AcrR family tetracycline transcriptional repressor